VTSEALGVVFVLGLLTLIAAVGVVLMWQIFATWRAKASVAREEAYQQLAERATTAAQQAVENQKQMSANMEEVRARVTSIEQILRDIG
jgi:nitrogen fixation protein FixH